MKYKKPDLSRTKSIVIVSSGNFLEMYDFMVFGYYAAWIGRAFFPTSSDFASLMLAFATFGAGFLMRPVGALVLGAYIDKNGRRKGLLLALTLMALGTASIALTPGYSRLGILAPLLIVVGRLLQGFSAGVEVGGVSVYLAEIATPNHEGFYVSWQSASQQMAVVFASLIGIVVTWSLSPNQLAMWGWRIPFAVGCLLIPFLFKMQQLLVETPFFLLRKTSHPTIAQIGSSLAAHWKVVVLGMMLATMTTVSFYMVTAYTPTYGASVLRLTARDSLTVALFVGISNFMLLPLAGTLSDKIGRGIPLISCSALALLTSYPALSWLVRRPTFSRLLLVELWLSIIYAGYNGAMIPFLIEIMPADVRTAGFSLAYSLATAGFGGFTPAICTYLIHETGNRAVPGLWLCVGALLGLSAAVTLSCRRLGPARERPSNLIGAAGLKGD